MRSTKALRASAAVHESQPTPVTLIYIPLIPKHIPFMTKKGNGILKLHENIEFFYKKYNKLFLKILRSVEGRSFSTT